MPTITWTTYLPHTHSHNMTNKTTDQSFKKTHQVVGANGGQLVDNLNEKIMKEAPGHDGVRLLFRRLYLSRIIH